MHEVPLLVDGNRTIVVSACDCTFRIQCPDDETAAIVKTSFSELSARCEAGSQAGSTWYDVRRAAAVGSYRVVDSEGREATFDDQGSLLFYLDKQITLSLQRRRPDLYFLHAAAVALDDRVAVLAAPAGTGKSTMTLALLANRFAYLSDELTPIDPETLLVHPYPRALSLKRSSPDRNRLPQGTLDTGVRLHVPVDALGVAVTRPLPLGALFFLKRQRTESPECLSSAGGAAFVMANALNSAAHPSDGLDIAIRLSAAVPCFSLDSSDLDAACSAVAAVLTESSRCGKESFRRRPNL